MIIHLAVGGVPLLPMAYVTLVFLFGIAGFVLAVAIDRLRDHNTRTGVPWLMAAILIVVVNITVAINSFGGYYIQSLLLDVVAFAVFASITIGVLVHMIQMLKKPRQKYYAIPSIGLLIIAVSVWLWNGIFRFFGGLVLDLVGGVYLATSLISMTVFYIGGAVSILGGIACLIVDAVKAKNRREEAAEAAS